MHDTQNHKKVLVVNTQLKDNAAFVSGVLDTNGFDEVCFDFIIGATDIGITSLKVRESDAANMSGATDVPGADFSVSPATLPGASDDNTLLSVKISLLGGRKRYYDISGAAADGTAGVQLTVLATLARAKQTPDTATKRGYTQELIIK